MLNLNPMSVSNDPRMALEHANAITELAHKMSIDKAVSNNTIDELEKSGNIKLSSKRLANLEGKIAKLAGGGNIGNIGIAGQSPTIGMDTFELSNVLIQDYGAHIDAEDVFDKVMPFKTVDAVTYNQDILAANYGYSDGLASINGGANVLPLLTASNEQYNGYFVRELSEISGIIIPSLRELGSSDTKALGWVQRRNYQAILLFLRAKYGNALNRIEFVQKGSMTLQTQDPTTPLVVGAGLLSSTLGSLGASIGAYNTTTKVFTPNGAFTSDPFPVLGQFLNTMTQTNIRPECVVLSAPLWSWIYSLPGVQAKMIYQSAVGSNKAEGIRDNVYQLWHVPALGDIPLYIDYRGLKLDENVTTLDNTRPLIWGKSVTASSFYSVIVTKPSGLSRVGDWGFFPNPYKMSSPMAAETTIDGNFSLITQDLRAFDILNQKIQMVMSYVAGPMCYQPQGIYRFNWGVTITS